MKNQMEIPADGIKGLKQNWSKDLVSGFIVSLLALPLSLGIAKASDFPPVMGVMTAIIGGMIVSLISGSRLTIKGPAAGLIVIVAGCVAEFGGGDPGWHMALGAIVTAALIQIVFGLLKLGKFSDFFPVTVIHGMLGAIGLIIMSKQLNILMGVNPSHADGPLKGKPLVEPIDLFMEIPRTIEKLLVTPDNQKILLVGIVALIIVFGWPMIKNKIIKRIPAPLVVLLITIPLSMALGIGEIKGGLVKVGNLFDVAKLNVSFDGIFQTGTFIKFVLLFSLIGSIESLLTVKAIDLADPFKRKSDTNKDVIAIGVGNALSGILGGLPMISEVARSSANVSNGGKTRWANFFHGTFLLLFVVALVPVIELIPNAALAAMLIGVGYRLASPKEFIHTLKIGWEQLVILVSTTIVILFTDLLVGVLFGILVKFVLHFINGLPLRNVFKADVKIESDDNRTLVYVSKAAVFSNFMGIKKKLEALPKEKKLFIDLSHCYLVDHSSMDNLFRFKEEYERNGGECKIYGLERHKSISQDKSSAQIMPKSVRKELKDRTVAETLETRGDNTTHEHRIN
jgi:MFS superfamily sulfate permease-like transporter